MVKITWRAGIALGWDHLLPTMWLVQIQDGTVYMG